MPDNSGAVDLGAKKAEEQTEDTNQQPDPSAPRDVLLAFVVIVGLDGNPQVAQINDPGLNPLLSLTPDLIFGAVSTLRKDLQSQELIETIVPATAQTVLQALTQQAQAAMQQQAAHRQLAELGDLKGGVRG